MLGRRVLHRHSPVARVAIPDNSVYAVDLLQNEKILHKMYTVGEEKWCVVQAWAMDDVAESLTT